MTSCSASQPPRGGEIRERPDAVLEPRAAAAISPEAGRVGRRGLEGGGAGQAGAEAGDRGDSGVGEARGGRVVEELREGGDDHDRDRARVGAVDDAVLDRLPALAQRAVEARRVVVEDEHLVDVRVLADERDDVALPVAVAPDDRGVVERVGDRGGGGEPLLERRGGGRRERGQLDAEPLRLVRAEPRVAPRAGEDPEPAPARPGAADGECLGELEQVVHVVRPRRAGLARERAEHPLVAGQRAGVGRGRGGADRRRPDLQHRHADPRVGAARRAPRTAPRRPRRPRRAARRSARSGSVARWASQSAVLTTVSFPDEIAVWRRSPRRVASALTTRLPLCEISPTCPGSIAVQRIAPQRRAGVERDEAVAVRAADGERVPEGRGAQLGLERGPGRRGERGHGGGGGRDGGRDAGALAEAGGEDDRSSAPHRSRLVDQAGDRRRPGWR